MRRISPFLDFSPTGNLGIVALRFFPGNGFFNFEMRLGDRRGKILDIKLSVLATLWVPETPGALDGFGQVLIVPQVE